MSASQLSVPLPIFVNDRGDILKFCVVIQYVIWGWNQIYTYDGLYKVKDYDLEVES
jgi:hypothetical protein